MEGQDVRGHSPRLDATREPVGPSEVSSEMRTNERKKLMKRGRKGDRMEDGGWRMDGKPERNPVCETSVGRSFCRLPMPAPARPLLSSLHSSPSLFRPLSSTTLNLAALIPSPIMPAKSRRGKEGRKGGSKQGTVDDRSNGGERKAKAKAPTGEKPADVAHRLLLLLLPGKK